MKKHSTLAWERDFPPVFCHTSISFLKRCRGYFEAKRGDIACARAVVGACIKTERIFKLTAQYPSAVLIPVISKNNKLPEAFAGAIGLEIHKAVQMVEPLERKQMSGAERLLFRPEFKGSIDRGENYILVDDIVCRGVTISALRKFVLENGGNVLGATALAHSAASSNLNPAPDSLLKLKQKFEYQRLTAILKGYRIIDNLHELTYPEINYLLRFKEAAKIKEAFSKAARRAA